MTKVYVLAFALIASFSLAPNALAYPWSCDRDWGSGDASICLGERNNMIYNQKESGFSTRHINTVYQSCIADIPAPPCAKKPARRCPSGRRC